MTKLLLFTDGGSRGNPGPAAYGYVVYLSSPDVALEKSGAGIILEKCGNYLGETTNNQAEYSGLLEGIKWIINNKPSAHVAIKMDSLLVVNQVKGVYKMKNAALQPKFLEVKALLSKLPSYTIDYVPRAQNSVADSLVNEALDAHLK